MIKSFSRSVAVAIGLHELCVQGDLDELLLSVEDHLHQIAAGVGLDVPVPQLFADLLHVLPHSTRLLEEVIHIAAHRWLALAGMALHLLDKNLS